MLSRLSEAEVNPGLLHLMAGKYRAAIRSYRRQIGKQRSSSLDELEYLCAVAASGDLEAVAEGLRKYSRYEMDPPERARYLTATAYVRAHEGDQGKVAGLLREAVQNDPSFPLANLSLGRQLLLGEHEEEESRKYFRRAAELVPTSRGALLGLVTLKAETGEYRGAARAARVLVRHYVLDISGWLAWVTATMSAAPLGGRLPIIALMMSAFVPYLAPIMAIIWFGYSMLNFVNLRRISPRLALYPILNGVVFGASYLVRWLILGRLFP